MAKKPTAAAQASATTTAAATPTGTGQDTQGAAQTTEGGQTPTEDVKTDPTASGADQPGEANLTSESQDAAANQPPADGTATDAATETNSSLTDQGMAVLDSAFNEMLAVRAAGEGDAAEPYVYEGAAPATPYEAVPSHEHHRLNLVDATLGFPPEEAYEQLTAMDITEWSKPCRDYHAAILQYVYAQE